MANTNLPDKWVRRALHSVLDNLSVSGETIPCYDSRATGFDDRHYIIMGSQNNTPVRTKCGRSWEHSIQLDVITTYKVNSGSRRLLDEISEAVLPLVMGISLDVASGMVISKTEVEFPFDENTVNDGKIYYRKILRLSLTID